MPGFQLTEFLTDIQLEQFQDAGYLILREQVPLSYVDSIRALSLRHLHGEVGDIEYEAELNYPGAPESLESPGGRTVRRLRQAVSRDPVFLHLLREPFLLQPLQQLLGEHIVMPLAHHNCVMTKQPEYSSDTGWHQDTRYWSFSTPELVNAWIALGREDSENGCLQLLPGTHRQQFFAEQLDEARFLRSDLPQNQLLLASAVRAELNPGDLLLFHARCFHSATRNYSSECKLSAVFTFRSAANPPIPGSRSAALPELLLS
jgi:phytanoyl-CoA hydroxylase